MDAIFYMPVWQGLSFLILGIVSIGVLVVYITRKLIENNLSKQHEKVGRLLFRVSAGLIALLISLSYANERVEFNRVRFALEQEASLIANVYVKLGMLHSKEAETIRKELIKYVEYTISDEWEDANNNPYYSKITATIIEINKLAFDLPIESENQKILKGIIISELNEVVQLMQTRFYSKHALFPFLGYILGTGILFMWIFFTVYRPDFLSMMFLSLYNTFLIVLIYFIIVLSNVLVGTLKIGANAFEVFKEKGFDKMVNH